MINSKVKQILYDYGLQPSKMSDENNMIIFNDYFTIDMGFGRNNSYMSGNFSLKINNDVFEGKISFENGKPEIYNIEPCIQSIQEYIKKDNCNIGNINPKILEFLGIKQIKIELLY